MIKVRVQIRTNQEEAIKIRIEEVIQIFVI